MASVVVAVAGLLINVVFANDPMVPKISTYSVDDSLDLIKEKNVTFAFGEDRLHLRNENKKTSFILHSTRFALSLQPKEPKSK